jgi:hypothetical protein
MNLAIWDIESSSASTDFGSIIENWWNTI